MVKYIHLVHWNCTSKYAIFTVVFVWFLGYHLSLDLEFAVKNHRFCLGHGFHGQDPTKWIRMGESYGTCCGVLSGLPQHPICFQIKVQIFHDFPLQSKHIFMIFHCFRNITITDDYGYPLLMLNPSWIYLSKVSML